MKVVSQTVDRDFVLRELIESEPGSHFLLTYQDMALWRQVYPVAVKKFLTEDNNLTLVIPFYETTSHVRSILKREIRDFERYENERSIAIIDSIKAYFSEIGIMTFVQGLLKHAKAVGKDGISVMADMGSFHHMGRVNQLLEHEISLPSKYEASLRGFCIYHEENLAQFTPEQKEAVFEHHGKNFFIRG